MTWANSFLKVAHGPREAQPSYLKDGLCLKVDCSLAGDVASGIPSSSSSASASRGRTSSSEASDIPWGEERVRGK